MKLPKLYRVVDISFWSVRYDIVNPQGNLIHGTRVIKITCKAMRVLEPDPIYAKGESRRRWFTPPERGWDWQITSKHTWEDDMMINEYDGHNYVKVEIWWPGGKV